LFSDANKVLCQAEKLSSWVQLIRPGGGRLVRVQTCGLEGVLVVIEDCRGAVERKAQHLTVRRGVVAGHGRDVNAGVELGTAQGHDFTDRLDGGLGGHHGRRAHLEDLQDVGGVASPECRDRRGHGLGIRALERRHDLVVLLALVELFGQVVDPLAERPTHGMPPLDFGLRLRRQRGSSRQGRHDKDILHRCS
jgi:hypothetical protein